MRRINTETDRLLQVVMLCQEAVDEQRMRECRQGYGLDDYTEGRIVGAANLGRKVLRILKGDPEPEPRGRARRRMR